MKSFTAAGKSTHRSLRLISLEPLQRAGGRRQEDGGIKRKALRKSSSDRNVRVSE